MPTGKKLESCFNISILLLFMNQCCDLRKKRIYNYVSIFYKMSRAVKVPDYLYNRPNKSYRDLSSGRLFFSQQQFCRLNDCKDHDSEKGNDK
jgi:hypothetical protein